jgi:hypothetical protein
MNLKSRGEGNDHGILCSYACIPIKSGIKMIERLAFYILDSNTDNINLDMNYDSKVSYCWQENMKMPSFFLQSKYCSTK